MHKRLTCSTTTLNRFNSRLDLFCSFVNNCRCLALSLQTAMIELLTSDTVAQAVNLVDHGRGNKQQRSSKVARSKKADAKPAAKAAKKAKPPKLEDKPFNEFIQEHYLPTLKEAMEKENIRDIDLTFLQQEVPIKGEIPMNPVGK